VQQQRLNQTQTTSLPTRYTVHDRTCTYTVVFDGLVGGVVGETLQLHHASTAEGLEGGRRTRRIAEGSDSDSATVPKPDSLSVASEFPVPQCRVDRGALAGRFYRLVCR